MIGNIEIGLNIGNGHFGAVHEAIDPVRGKVAVKIFSQRPNETIDKWQKRAKNLLVEGQRLKQAEHPNVVQVYQIIEEPGRIVLVMEYCENGSLQGYHRNSSIPLANLRNILTDSAIGLSVLHSRGMLHRDIKPANILLDGSFKAKLGDFGLVTDEMIYGYASAAGYTDHIAKEVWDTRTTSIKTDIWAFGMTAYRLMHGKDFYDNYVESPRFNIPDGGFALKLPWSPHIPRQWRSFVRACMNDDPQKRYRDTQTLLDAIGKLPINNTWSCFSDDFQTIWTSENTNRVFEVKHTIHSSRKHEFYAVSRPKSNGRIRWLLNSNGTVSKRVVLSTLESFFEQFKET